MPTNRVRQRRAPALLNQTIAAIREDLEIDWSPEAWDTLIGAKYFGEHELSDEERERVNHLLKKWSDQQDTWQRARRA
jgi:hypothetical protein